MRNHVIAGFALLIVFAIGARALDAQPVVRVTMDEALERFADNGLALRIARAEARATSERARQEAAWPNPTLGAVHENLDDAAASYDETTLDLAQPLVWPWRQSARWEAADAIGREARARFRADSARAALEVVRTWLAAWEEARAVETLETALAVVRDVTRAAEARFRDGDLSGFELRRLRVERARYEADLVTRRIALRAARRRLATLIVPGSPAEEIGAAPGLPPVAAGVDVPEALARARTSRPEIAAASAAIEAARARARSRRASRLPEPTLQAGWKTQSDGLDGLVLGLALPVPLFDRRGAAASAASARLDEAAARARLIARRVEDEVRLAVERHAALLERAELQRESLLTEADDLLEIGRVAWSEGEISLLELLDATEAWRDALGMEADLEAELVMSGYELRRAIGRPIQHDEEGRR